MDPAGDPRSDEALLRAALRDPEAFGVVYHRHARRLTAFLVGRTRDPEVAADLVAETFAAALEHLHRFDPDRGEAGAWLYGIARHQLGRWARTGAVQTRARRRLGMPLRGLEDEELEEVERLADAEVVRVAVRQGLDALPPEQRDAVEARVLLGRDYDEIARDGRVTEAAARQRVSRGLAALRARLGKDDQ